MWSNKTAVIITCEELLLLLLEDDLCIKAAATVPDNVHD